jgi:hypothetical protein
MREQIIKVYKFDELSPEAQAVAIEKYREGMDWQFESEGVTENIKIKLEEAGLPTDDVEWSLSYCQGDGVAFYGYVDMAKVARRVLEGEALELYKLIEAEDLTISAKLYRNSFGHHYSHYNTMNVEIDGDSIDTIITYIKDTKTENGLTTEEWDEAYAKLEAFLEELETAIKEDVQTVSRQLEREGYEHLEYMQSDEIIKENIEANEYEFTADGKMY